MDIPTSPHIQGSSSSHLTVKSVRSDAVLELGMTLVEQLGLDRSNDTLARWMAHYIAQLIQDAESAKEDDRAEKLSACADAIIALWNHRGVLPNGMRPFESFESIMRTLESLDPDDDTPRYYRKIRMMAGKDKESDEARKWLELADGIDFSARVLIRHCLARAVDNSIEKSMEWVKLSEGIDAKEEIDQIIVRVVDAEDKILNSPTPNEAIREQIKNRIRKLDSFIECADALSSDLHERLRQLNANKGD